MFQRKRDSSVLSGSILNVRFIPECILRFMFWSVLRFIGSIMRFMFWSILRFVFGSEVRCPCCRGVLAVVRVEALI